MRRVPPRCCAPDARTPTHSDPSTTARPCGGLPTVSVLGDRLSRRIDPGDRTCELVADPHAARADRDVHRPGARADRDRRGLDAAARVDARHRAVPGVGHPQRSRAPREAARAAARRDPTHHVAAAGADLRHGPRRLAAGPHEAAAARKLRGHVVQGDRLSAPADWIEAQDRAVIGDRDPHRPAGYAHAARPVADRDVVDFLVRRR